MGGGAGWCAQCLAQFHEVFARLPKRLPLVAKYHFINAFSSKTSKQYRLFLSHLTETPIVCSHQTIVCCRQTIVCSHQTMVCSDQTMECIMRTKEKTVRRLPKSGQDGAAQKGQKAKPGIVLWHTKQGKNEKNIVLSQR